MEKIKMILWAIRYGSWDCGLDKDYHGFAEMNYVYYDGNWWSLRLWKFWIGVYF